MAKTNLLILSLLLLAALASAKTAQEWKTRNIYQIITDRFALGNGSTPGCDLSRQPYYCGGDFKGIEKNLDYIANLGFNAIWISPVPDNYPNEYHGYAAKNMTQINSKFGGEAGLKSLISACHARDIWVMVDVVANHMGNTNLDFSQNVPFNSASDYHSYCIITTEDYQSKNMYNIQHCRIGGLADLDQSVDYVKNYLLWWVKDLVQTYKIDGLRIDTVQQIEPTFWKGFTDSAGVFATGEVSDNDIGFLASFIPYVGSLHNYPWYITVRDIFINGRDMWGIRNQYWSWAAKNVDASILTPFIDNHDQPRFLSDELFGSRDRATRIKLLKGYSTLTLTSVGISIMYYGTEQLFSGGNDPYDREPLWFTMNQQSEMYLYVQKILKAKTLTQAGTQDQVEAFIDADVYAFYRGKMFVGVTNKLYTVSKEIITLPFKNGDVICNVFYPKDDCITIQNNKFQLTLLSGEAKIFLLKSQLQSAASE